MKFVEPHTVILMILAYPHDEAEKRINFEFVAGQVQEVWFNPAEPPEQTGADTIVIDASLTLEDRQKIVHEIFGAILER